jgi:hypothetical protein
MTSRPEFRKWVDNLPDAAWPMMPLTHICKAFIANDIVRDGQVAPSPCGVFERSLAYFFYGRPAYRTQGDGPVKKPAACPMCFIFDPKIMDQAEAIHPFDTGAFHARLYRHAMLDEMAIGDFSLERHTLRPNRIINTVYGSRSAYFDGDRSKIPEPSKIAGESEFLVQAYIELLRSAGRNEPDDRVGTIEVVMGEAVPLEGNLLAVVVPDILWNDKDKESWLVGLADAGVQILPFRFLHGREPEHHHAMIEVVIRDFYDSRGEL